MKKFNSVIVFTVAFLVSVLSFAATYDLTVGNADGYSATLSSPRFFVLERTIDFSSRNVVSNDVIEVFDIVANTAVLTVQAEVLTASSTALGAIHVGDGGSAARHISAMAITNINDSAKANADYYYTSADTIDLTVAAGASITNGSVRVRVGLVDLTN